MHAQGSQILIDCPAAPGSAVAQRGGILGKLAEKGSTVFRLYIGQPLKRNSAGIEGASHGNRARLRNLAVVKPEKHVDDGRGRSGVGGIQIVCCVLELKLHCSIQLPLLMIPSQMNTKNDVFVEEPAPHIPAKADHWSGEIGPPSRTVPDSPVRSETACA